MGRAGLHGRGPHREASVIGQDLHVAAEGLVLTRVPQVVAGLGAGCDPVSAHQGTVQADERFAVPAEPVHDVDEIGRPLGDDLQGLVQVPVSGGLRDTGVAGQGPHISAVLEPPQHHNGLDPGGGGPLMRAGVVGAAVGGQPAADGTHSGDGYVDSGTIGHPRGASWGSSGILVETDPAHRSRVHPPATHPDPCHRAEHTPGSRHPDEKTS